MDSNYKVIITAVGRQKLAFALASGTTVKLKQIALGDGNGNVVEPAETQTALVREVYRGEMLSCAPLASAPENIVCVMAVPASVGGWSVREIGIFDTDGALFAVGNIAEAYKPAPSEGASREMLLRCVIGIGTTDIVELVTDPTQVIATQDFVQNAIDEMVHGIGELGDELREWAKLIGKYKYEVLTREEYDAIVAAGKIADDVIYFVKGTRGLDEIRGELAADIARVRDALVQLRADHATDVSLLSSRITAFDDALKALSARVDALDPDLATEVSELITTYDTAIAELIEQCNANASGLTTVSTTVNGIITEVDEKLNSVETRLTEKLSSIAEAKVQTAVEAEATARTGADTVLQGSVTRLSDTSTDHETRIKANEAAIAEFVAGDAAWEQSLLEASTQVGSRLITHEEKVAASNVLGHVYVGGNGVGISNGVLALNIRTNHSGIQFANKAAYVNCAEQTLHPTAGTVAKVATDTAGALVVPDATDTTKGGVLIDKLDTDTGVLTKPVIVDGMLGERARVLHGEIQGDINAHGWKCTTEDLGAEAGATIVPVEISFYRRASHGESDSTAPRYLRILRASADGTAWQIAYQSTNGLAPNSFTAGTAMTWKMRNVDGRGAIPAGETILITQTDTPQSIATANVRWGAKNTTTAHGVIVVSSAIPSDPNGTVSTSTYSPAADMTYYKVEPLADAFAAKTHTHAVADVDGLQAAIDAKADATALATNTADIAALAARVATLESTDEGLAEALNQTTAAYVALAARVAALENA